MPSTISCALFQKSSSMEYAHALEGRGLVFWQSEWSCLYRQAVRITCISQVPCVLWLVDLVVCNLRYGPPDFLVCCPAQCNVSFSAASYSTFFNFHFNRPYFTVECLIALPLHESAPGVDLFLIETSLPFLWKLLLISMRTASLPHEKQGGFYQNRVNTSLTFIQRSGN